MCLEVWMWVHQENGISWILRISYSVESTHITVNDDGGMNQRDDVTYYRQRKKR